MEKQIRNKKGWYIWLIILALLALLIYLAFDSSLKTQIYTVEDKRITENVKIALLTDLHSCYYGENQAELVSAINKESPDLILLGGDICDDVIPHTNTEILLAEISEKYPCYYVTGNHEYWGYESEQILQLFSSYGVTILNGSYEPIEVNGQKINICGITDPDIINYTNSNLDIYTQLDSLSQVHENGNFTVLLSHRPEEIGNYLNRGFDLVLCGHAHGGQIRIPFLINGLFAPNQGWFPKYAGGQYDFEDLSMIVSRGLAKESTAVPRIFNPPELVIVNLT